MTIDLIVVGKTDHEAVAELVAMYMKRIGFYARFSIVTLPDVKRGGGASAVRRDEGEAILRNTAPGDHVVLLDSGGAERSSEEFAAWLEKRSASGLKRLVFVIGGAYGFSPDVYARANERLSLSRMTFSHQIVRAIFAEQLYRAFTIIRGEPYHHG